MGFTLDAVATGTASGTSITIASGAKLAIVTFAKRSVNDPTSVQLGGVSMTRLTERVNGTALGAEIWYLINPPTGTVSLTYSLTGNHRHTVSSYTVGAGNGAAYDGVENGGSGTGTNPSFAVTPANQPNLIISVCVHEGSAAMTAKGAGQVGLEPSSGDGFYDEGVWNTAHTYEPTTSVSSDTQSFTSAANDTYAMAVAVFKETTPTPTRGLVSFAEFEAPFVLTRGLISFAETEVPLAPTRGLISFAELEAPLVPTRGLVSWAESEVPTALTPTRGLISFAELETPFAPTRGLVSFAEMETPDAGGGEEEGRHQGQKFPTQRSRSRRR